MHHAIARFVPSSTCTRLFAGVTAFQAVFVVAIEAIIVNKGSLAHRFFSSGSGPNEQSVLPVYLGIFLLANLFQLVLTIDAIASRNTIEIIGLDIFQLMLMVYSVVQISEVVNVFDSVGSTDNSVPILLDLIPIFMALVFVVYMFLTWPIYKIQGWDTFKFLGADRRIKRCHFAYQVFLAHLKFDYFILLAFSLQLVLLVLDQDDIERYLTLAAVPVTLGFLVMGYIGIKRENKFITVLFMFTMGGQIGYFAYKIFRIYQNPDGIYTLVKKSLTGFAVLALIAAVSTLGCAIRCYLNFGIGLKRHLDGTLRRGLTRMKTMEAGLSPEPSPELSKAELSQYQLAASSRMSID